MGKDRKNWRPPGPEHCVDRQLLSSFSNTTLQRHCHACRNPTWHLSGSGELTISPDKPNGTSGFFFCTKAACGRIWCVACLKNKDIIPDDFDSSFDGENGTWRQIREECWHCSKASVKKPNTCHPSCPSVIFEERRAKAKLAREEADRKRKAEESPPNPPSPKREKLAPPLPLPGAVQIASLAEEVREKKLFSQKPWHDFIYIVPDFERKKDGSLHLVEPSLGKRRFPTLVSWCPGTPPSLRCTGTGRDCKGRCIHIEVLEQLVDLRNHGVPISPDERFNKKYSPLQLSKVGFEVPGVDYWAFIEGTAWVFCGVAKEEWACQCRTRSHMCEHVCRAAGLTYKAPPFIKRYGRPQEDEWAEVKEGVPAASPKVEGKMALVCDVCRPPHADGISADAFTPCNHNEHWGKLVHVCTVACAWQSCSVSPSSQDSGKGPLNHLRKEDMMVLSDQGFFSQSPPVDKLAPCGQRWLRRPTTASFYMDLAVSDVKLCVWQCINACCFLRPEIEEVYFQPPSSMHVSHSILRDRATLVYQANSFKVLSQLSTEFASSKGSQAPLQQTALTQWFQKYLRDLLFKMPQEALPPQPSPKPWTPAMRSRLRELPAVREPANPLDMVGWTLWKYFRECNQWFPGIVTGYSLVESTGKLWPMYQVFYPGGDPNDPKGNFEKMTWADLRHRLNPVSEKREVPQTKNGNLAYDKSACWELRDSQPPAWEDVPGKDDSDTPPDPDPNQRPWATCPCCGVYPEALYIDCREAYMKRTYRPPTLTKPTPVAVLPITYPYTKRVTHPNVCPEREACLCNDDQTTSNRVLETAPKIVGTARVRHLLARWSGHIPVTEKIVKERRVSIPELQPVPLKDNELDELMRRAPSCIKSLIDYVGGAGKNLCPDSAYKPLFYHLGFMHSDTPLLPHGAQDTVLQLLLALKRSQGWGPVDVPVDWDRTLATYAPTLRNILERGRDDPGGNNTGFQEPLTAGTLGYRVKRDVLVSLAPLLQHLLRLSYRVKDFDLGPIAADLLCKALGVKPERVAGKGKLIPAEMWLGREECGAVRRGKLIRADVQKRLADEIRALMSGPCRGTSEGIQAGEEYVVNQHRLSSSSVYHRVYRDGPQYVGRDAENGMCEGGESWNKCKEWNDDTLPELSEDEQEQQQKGGRKDADGVMVVTCKHRFVYYYHILLRHESVRDVFTFLVTRFEHRPPRFIIYDNACELHRYCESRWPAFFAETMFLTDVFHGVCHKCGDEFKYYKHFLDEGRDPRNTSVAEQINSLMKRFDRIVAASSIDTAMVIYDYFVYRHNVELRKKMLERSADEAAARG